MCLNMSIAKNEFTKTEKFLIALHYFTVHVVLIGARRNFSGVGQNHQYFRKLAICRRRESTTQTESTSID